MVLKGYRGVRLCDFVYLISQLFLLVILTVNGCVSGWPRLLPCRTVALWQALKIRPCVYGTLIQGSAIKSLRDILRYSEGVYVHRSSIVYTNIMKCLTSYCIWFVIWYVQYVYCVVVLPDGRIASGSEDWTICIWNVTTGVCDVVLKGHNGVRYRDCAVHTCIWLASINISVYYIYTILYSTAYLYLH